MCDPKLCACENCLNRPGAPDVPQSAQLGEKVNAAKSKAIEKAIKE